MLIHDGGGTALAYRLLGDVGRTLLGIHSPGLREGKGIVSIRHAADEYAAFARQWLKQHSHHSSRLLVGGWSLGGTIAIALAAAHPDLVRGVILIDPPPPGTAAMKSEEAARIIPSATARSSSSFSALVRGQLTLNSRSLNADTDCQGGQRGLFTGLQAPVYLVSATKPLSNVGTGGAEPAAPGSCMSWMMRRDRAEVAEAAWAEVLGDLLVGTTRTASDHFTMFTQSHASSTTLAVQRAVAALEASIRKISY
jgi:pimeloyl-ACP methyl ester carboxylesterase